MLAGEWKQTYTASATAAGTTVQASAKLFPVDLREVSIDDEALVWVPSGVFDSSSLVRVPQAGGTGPASFCTTMPCRCGGAVALPTSPRCWWPLRPKFSRFFRTPVLFRPDFR